MEAYKSDRVKEIFNPFNYENGVLDKPMELYSWDSDIRCRGSFWGKTCDYKGLILKV